MNAVIDPTIVWLTFRQLFVRRRLVASAIVSLVPGILALLYRLRSGTDADSAQFLIELYSNIVLGTLLPLAAVVFGTAVFGGEIEDGTIVYVLVKPIARWRVVVSKYIVAIGATAAVMVPAVVLPWLFLGAGPVAVPAAFAAGIGLGTLIYSALFLVLGLTTKRGLVAGLLYIVVVEFVLSRAVPGARSVSIRELMLTIVPTVAPTTAAIPAGTVSLATVWTMGAIILVGSIAQAMRWLQRYEMAERL